MPTNPEFIKALLEKLSNIKNKNIEQDASIGGQNLKRTSSSTPKGDTNSESTPIPGTPNAFETKSTQKSTDSKSSNKIEDLVKDSTNLPAEEKPVDLVGKKNVGKKMLRKKLLDKKLLDKKMLEKKLKIKGILKKKTKKLESKTVGSHEPELHFKKEFKLKNKKKWKPSKYITL